MIETARGKVALPYTLLLAVIVLFVAVGAYWLIQNNAYLRLDETLHSSLKLASLTLVREMQEHRAEGRPAGEAAFRKALDTIYQTSFPQEQIVVRDGARVVAYKKNMGRSQGDLRTVPVTPGPSAENSLDLRVATKIIPLPAVNTIYTLSVSTWRGDVSNDLASVLRALATTVPSALLLSLVGGYFLARRTLAPLRTMTETVDAITSRNLDRRVAVVNPKDELGQLAGRFNNLLERLQNAFLQQRQFMADASHELRTPIASALTTAQVTLGTATRSEAEYREALAIVEEQMLRLRRIVGDMFLLAQADAHALQHRLKKVYLDEIVAEASRAIRFLAESRGLHLHNNPLPEMPCIGDSGLLRQALLVLLDNACKYTPTGGSIRIEAQQTSENYIVRVIDTGTGIPASSHERIFERFYRVDKSRSRTGVDGGGAGLGLPISRWIAQVHGGAINLESSGPFGSTFALHLPRASFAASPAEKTLPEHLPLSSVS